MNLKDTSRNAWHCGVIIIILFLVWKCNVCVLRARVCVRVHMCTLSISVAVISCVSVCIICHIPEETVSTPHPPAPPLSLPPSPGLPITNHIYCIIVIMITQKVINSVFLFDSCVFVPVWGLCWRLTPSPAHLHPRLYMYCNQLTLVLHTRASSRTLDRISNISALLSRYYSNVYLVSGGEESEVLVLNVVTSV